jgi:hypothetical protein
MPEYSPNYPSSRGQIVSHTHPPAYSHIHSEAWVSYSTHLTIHDSMLSWVKSYISAARVDNSSQLSSYFQSMPFETSVTVQIMYPHRDNFYIKKITRNSIPFRSETRNGLFRDTQNSTKGTLFSSE